MLSIGASVGLANKPNTRPVGQPNMPCVGQANNYIQLTCWRPTNCWPNTRVNGKFRANMKYIRSLRNSKSYVGKPVVQPKNAYSYKFFYCIFRRQFFRLACVYYRRTITPHPNPTYAQNRKSGWDQSVMKNIPVAIIYYLLPIIYLYKSFTKKQFFNE